MAAFSSSRLEMKKDLRYAIAECSARGLIHSVKWSAEQAISLPSLPPGTELQKRDEQDEKFLAEYDSYILGKGYFDTKEFDRAATFLENCTSHKGFFLYIYSLYLAGEKRKDDNVVDIMGPLEKGNVFNKSLKSLREELSKRHKNLDGFCLYLYGIVLRALDLRSEAFDVFVEAIHKEPLHWGAWSELASLCGDKSMFQRVDLPEHWMVEFFLLHAYIELQMNDEALQQCEKLVGMGFGDSSYIQSQRAIAYYNLREFDAAVKCFMDLQQADPNRLDHMDTYSNILYVKEMKPELAYLAQESCQIDKYRVETCCIVGNYYSLCGQHDKAVIYFQRALKLNPNYVSAWTLMGHEYMEMKNTSAAIESYRRGLEVCPRDYRAWYGLGQMYEILRMHHYCLYYYNKAQQLKPNDSRMHVALGDNYDKLGRYQHAKKCYWRAVCVGDMEGIAAIKLARLHEKLDEKDDAAKFYTRCVEQAETVGVVSAEELSHSYRFLASYYKSLDKLQEAEHFAFKCCEFNETREEGKSILRSISIMRTQGECEVPPSEAFTPVDSRVESREQNNPPDDGLSPMNLTFSGTP